MIGIRGGIFRPQTRRIDEITVLYTHLADNKLGVDDVRSIKTITLLLSIEYIDKYKTYSPKLRTQRFQDFFAKGCVCNTVISPNRRVCFDGVQLQLAYEKSGVDSVPVRNVKKRV
jgi:hypothetical protein